jgi:hypothetical protein
MAKCSICGAETMLYSNGVPICLDCDKANEERAVGSSWATENGKRRHHPGQTAARPFNRSEEETHC